MLATSMALHRVALLILAFFIWMPVAAIAQTPAAPAATSPSTDQLLKPEQLDALVAPIALYPDNLLSLVLMASTYPLEVVQADRWVREHKTLKGEQQKTEVDKQAWDESVKSLVATPDVLSMMSTKLDWTLKLGDAVLAQQADVMDAIQRLRTKAEANNKLTSTKQQTVTKRQEQGRQVIAIEPADPETIYVPYYDPAVVYVPGHIQSIRRTIGVTPDISAQGLSGPASHLAPAGRSDAGVQAEIIGAEVSIGTTTTSTSTGQGLTRWPATIGNTGRSTGRASDTTITTCDRSSVTTICAVVRRTGWISAARVVSKSLGPAAIDRARDKDPGQDKRLANGPARGNGPRVDGQARGSGLQAGRPAPSGRQAENVLRSGRLVDEAATHLATSGPEELLNVTPHAGAQASPGRAVACEWAVAVVDSVAEVGADSAEVAAVVAAVAAAADDPISCSSMISFSSAIWRTGLAITASATTAAIVPMSA